MYSVDHEAIRAVIVARVQRTPVTGHSILHVLLANGRTLDVSAAHPTADGRRFGELRPGDTLDKQPIAAVVVEPYNYPATYDILPASDTGFYFAAGVRIGSTLSFPPSTP